MARTNSVDNYFFIFETSGSARGILETLEQKF